KGRMRRGHYGTSVLASMECPHCHELKLPHRVCPHCGYYNGMEIVSVSKEEE
ncbi:MAG TPA: 50S ribosomal protein L32, partial [Candidatus Acetothermia bacterium]|nr:50S ribosomal protein L32 [Candidatus Acetothermia bacterium]